MNFEEHSSDDTESDSDENYEDAMDTVYVQTEREYKGPGRAQIKPRKKKSCWACDEESHDIFECALFHMLSILEKRETAHG